MIGKLLKGKIKNKGVHGKNIIAKLNKYSKLSAKQKKLMPLIVKKYNEWSKANNALVGYRKTDIEKRVSSVSKYKKFVEQVDFKAQSKFHSSVLEEFVYYLFKDLIKDMNEKIRKNETYHEIKIGGTKAYCNIYFCPKNIKDFLINPSIKSNVKDQDFTIYREVLLEADGKKETRVNINVPVVSIEAKTYIDKTMLEGSIATAEKIKNGNPYCLFIVIAETYDVSLEVDPAYSRIDKIYILRKQKSPGKKDSKKLNPINSKVTVNVFNKVKNHLEKNWSNVKQKLEKDGEII